MAVSRTDASKAREIREIPVAKPVLDEREAEAARRPILSGWLAQGPEVEAFEREFAAAVGARHACAVSSSTTALHLALLAASVGPGDQVVTVSHSHIATANAIRYCGATPVFVDIEAEPTYNLDWRRVQGALTRRTRAILCVHQMGMPCDLSRIVDIGRRHEIPVIEDAACAVGSEVLWNGRFEGIGRPHGDVACFSFHRGNVITTGDGGMLTTARPEWDRKFRLLREHAATVPETVRNGARCVIFEAYAQLGFHYGLTDIQAAVGREQLKRLPEIVGRRRAIAARYGQLLARIQGLVTPVEPAFARSNWQRYCVRLPEACDQRRVIRHLMEAGISSRRGITCAHREPAYALEPWSCGSGPDRCACPDGRCRRLLESERAQDRSIVLPLYSQMTDDDVDYVAGVLADAVAAC